MILFLVFMVLTNGVAIALIYSCLSGMEKKEKLIFIGVSIAIIYVLTSFVYWLSTKDVPVKEVSDSGKNIITFLFVPINAIIVVPIIAKSYNNYKYGNLDSTKYKKRVIIMSIILLIILAVECSYFKSIQNGVIEMLQNSKNKINTNRIVEDIKSTNSIKETNTD